MRRCLAILSLAAVLATLAGLASCRGPTSPFPTTPVSRISGTVTGVSGRPAIKATISAYAGSDLLAFAFSDSLGHYAMTVRTRADTLLLSAMPDMSLVFGDVCTGHAQVARRPVVTQDIVLDQCTPI